MTYNVVLRPCSRTEARRLRTSSKLTFVLIALCVVKFRTINIEKFYWNGWQKLTEKAKEMEPIYLIIEHRNIAVVWFTPESTPKEKLSWFHGSVHLVTHWVNWGFCGYNLLLMELLVHTHERHTPKVKSNCSCRQHAAHIFEHSTKKWENTIRISPLKTQQYCHNLTEKEPSNEILTIVYAI